MHKNNPCNLLKQYLLWRWECGDGKDFSSRRNLLVVSLHSQMQPVFITLPSPARAWLEVAREPITEQRAGVAAGVSSGFCDPNRFTDKPI